MDLLKPPEYVARLSVLRIVQGHQEQINDFIESTESSMSQETTTESSSRVQRSRTRRDQARGVTVTANEKLNISPSSLVQFIGGFAFRSIRTIHKFRDAFLRSS